MKSVAVLALAAGGLWAQVSRPFMITTYAGKGRIAFTQENASPTSAQLMRAERVAVDLAGNLYVTDSFFHRVFKVTPGGTITTLAGTGDPGYNGDNIAARSAQLNAPTGVAVDAAGNVFVADAGNQRVRIISPKGVIGTVAGVGTAGYSGDRGAAAKAAITDPAGLALDANGNLYIADRGNHAIRMVDASGVITTVAGSGISGSTGDGAAATAARLNLPEGVALDTAGDLYIADAGNHKVRKVAMAKGTIATIAGTGAAGYAGEAVAAVSALLSYPMDVVVDSHANVYIADSGNYRIRKIAPDATIITAAGTGVPGTAGDNDYTFNAQFEQPSGLALDTSNNLFVADRKDRRVRRMFTGYMYASVGVGALRATGDNGKATAAQLLVPSGLAFDSTGGLFIADREDNRLRRVAPNGTITCFTGNGVFGYPNDGVPAATAQLPGPASVALSPAGYLYIGAAYKVLKSDGGSVISTAAGSGVNGDAGDDGPASRAAIGANPRVILDAAGNLYISDTDHHRIRRVSASGVIATIAGTGAPGYGGDGAQAVSAKLNSPAGLALDQKGNLYVADKGNQRIRRIGTDGVITTVAGDGTFGPAGDGGKAAAAKLANPMAVALDAAGNLYIADWSSSSIRRVGTDGIIATIAGTGASGYGGDGGPSTQAQLNGPEALTVDAQGFLYVADTGNARVRRLEPAQIFYTGVVNAGSYVSGTVSPGEAVAVFGVDFGPATLTTAGLNAAGNLDTVAAETRVFFDNLQAPMLYATRGQLSAIVPYGVAGKATTQMRIEYQGQPTNILSVPVAATAPGLFTFGPAGKGQAAAVNQDNTINSAANPAARGSVVMFYGTGEGQTSPAGVDGRIAKATLPKPTQAVSAKIGGVTATVTYAGGAPNFSAGILQVNVRIPDTVTPGGAVPVTIAVGANSSQADVTLAVK